MPSQRQLKQLLRFAGYGVVAFCLWYLGRALLTQYQALMEFEWEGPVLGTLIIGAMVYAIVLGLLVLSFTIMLFGVKPSRLQTRLVFGVYGRSSVGKYLPGNVFHYVGRQVLGRTLNVSQVRIGLASIAEVGFSIFSAILITALFFSFSANATSLVTPLESQLLLGVMLVALAVLFLVARLTPAFPRWLPEKLMAFVTHLQELPLLPAYCLNILFFIFMGIIAAVSCSLLSGADIDLLRIAVLYLLAWVVGFVVPGASGGLGVREAVLVAQISPELGEVFALVFALFMRFQSILGDAFLFAASLLASDRVGTGEG